MRKPLYLLLLAGAALGATRWPPTRDVLSAWKDAVIGGVYAVSGGVAADRGRMAAQMLFRRRLERAVREYKTLHGTDPEALDDLVRASMLQKDDLVDEWGRALAVEPQGSGFRVRSAGPDGRFHTGDDWTLDV